MLPQYTIKIKTGSADASKNNKNKNKFVHENAHNKHNSIIKNKHDTSKIFIVEYQEVSNEIIKINVLNSKNGKLIL